MCKFGHLESEFRSESTPNLNPDESESTSIMYNPNPDLAFGHPDSDLDIAVRYYCRTAHFRTQRFSRKFPAHEYSRESKLSVRTKAFQKVAKISCMRIVSASKLHKFPITHFFLFYSILLKHVVWKIGK